MLKTKPCPIPLIFLKASIFLYSNICSTERTIVSTKEMSGERLKIYSCHISHIIIYNKSYIITFDNGPFFLCFFQDKMAKPEGHCNEAFEHELVEPSSNNLEKKAQASEAESQSVDSGLKRKILKNVILISVAFMVLFTSYQSMSTLQSSINKASKGFRKQECQLL